MKWYILAIIFIIPIYFLIKPSKFLLNNKDFMDLRNFLSDSKNYNELGNTIFLGGVQMTGLFNNNSSICGVDIAALGLAGGVPTSLDLYNLMKALIYKESSGVCTAYNPLSSSNSLESIGLCQITEPVANLYGYTLSQLASTGFNVYVGTQYFIKMLKLSNWNPEKAYSFYNGGSNPSQAALNNASNYIQIYNNFKESGIWTDSNGMAFNEISCNC